MAERGLEADTALHSQKEDSTADQTRAGEGPGGSSKQGPTQGRGRWAAGGPGPPRQMSRSGPRRKRALGPPARHRGGGRSGSSPGGTSWEGSLPGRASWVWQLVGGPKEGLQPACSPCASHRKQGLSGNTAPAAFRGRGAVGRSAKAHVELILSLVLHSSVTKTKK